MTSHRGLQHLGLQHTYTYTYTYTRTEVYNILGVHVTLRGVSKGGRCKVAASSGKTGRREDGLRRGGGEDTAVLRQGRVRTDARALTDVYVYIHGEREQYEQGRREVGGKR